VKPFLRPALVAALQVAGVFAAGSAGYALASALHLPLPGNVLAIVVLYTLLATKLVRLEWLDRGATLITTNLVLFIVPLAVGLMTFGDVLVREGAPLIAVLLVSLGCGIVVTGRIAEGGESGTKA
jgi:holin-like protein